MADPAGSAHPRAGSELATVAGVRGVAFGLEIVAPRPLAGVRAALPTDTARRRVHLELLDPDELELRWPDGCARVFEQRLPGDSGHLILDEHDQHGYRVLAPRYGSAVVSSDGSSIAFAAPEGAPAWVAERFLVAQILPLAAVLQELEVFHASAAVLGDRLVAFSGPSGTGKTTLALELACRGARLFTDDVLAVDSDSPQVVCHPGAGSANVRDPRLVALAEEGRPPFGEVLGRSGTTLRALVETEPAPRPLDRLYLLTRDPGIRHPRLERVERADELLASTFNFAVRTPARLARQLAACANIGAAAEVVRLAIPAGYGVSRTAALVERAPGG